MFAVNFTVAAIVMATGFLGNVGVLAISMVTKTFKSPYVINMVVFDMLAVIFGPGIFLISSFVGSNWLSTNPIVCQVSGFLQNLTILCSFFGMIPIICYGRQLHRFFPKTRTLHFILAASWIWAIALSSPPLLGWNSYSYIHHFKTCSYSTPEMNPGDSYSYFLAALSLGLHVVVVFLCYSAIKAQRGYRMTLHWQRHKRELQLNDPERTTVASSQSEMSFSNSIEMLLTTLANTKLHSKVEDESSCSFHSRVVNEPDDNSMEQLHFPSRRPPCSVYPNESEARADASNLAPVCNLPHIKEEYCRKESVLDPPACRPAAYTICLNDKDFHSKKPHKFKGIISLKSASEMEDHRNSQFVRMLLIKSCVSLLGWCPFYVVNILSLVNVVVPEPLWLVVNWLCLLRPVLAPVLYPISCSEYWHAVKTSTKKIGKAVVPCFKDAGGIKRCSLELGKENSIDELSENKQVALTKVVLFPAKEGYF